MAEYLYVTPDINTEHLREASHDVLRHGQTIAAEVADRLIAMGTKVSEIPWLDLRTELSLERFNRRGRQKWAQSETWLSRMLHMSHTVILPPEITDPSPEKAVIMTVEEANEHIPRFWAERLYTIHNLLTALEDGRIDTIRTANTSYSQSVLMRRALRAGIYHTHSHNPPELTHGQSPN